MKAPLQIAIQTGPLSTRVAIALRRLSHNVGSVEARTYYKDAPAELRLLCVHVMNAAAVAELGAGLRRELADDPAALMATDATYLIPVELETLVCVFVDCFAVQL